jgi:ankyrin repeat protein
MYPTSATYLLKGVDVNVIGGHYGTALQVAAYHWSIEIVQLLLEKGADVKAIGGKYS